MYEKIASRIADLTGRGERRGTNFNTLELQESACVDILISEMLKTKQSQMLSSCQAGLVQKCSTVIEKCTLNI